MKRLPLICMCVAAMLLLAAPVTAQASREGVSAQLTNIRRLARAADSALTPALQARMVAAPAGEKIPVILMLNTQVVMANTLVAGVQTSAARHKALVEALRGEADQSQTSLRELIAAFQAAGQVDHVISLWIFNGISMHADASALAQLGGRSDVYQIQQEVTFAAPPFDGKPIPANALTPAAAGAQPNIALTNAPLLWNKGITGQGVVVASVDTGVDVNHPDLSAQYRGGSNSWYDPYGEFATPVDSADISTGHGTATLSVILGRDASGSSIGMAPNATWIAAKLFDSNRFATTTAAHQIFQWLLDPDGNPDTNDAPQVVNNSWTFDSPSCDLSMQFDLQNLRNAGILPIFSAGNFGNQGMETGSSPANYPQALSVGAIDNSSNIASFSSRGPNTCAGGTLVFPALVAPGVSVVTAAPGGTYLLESGTSFSAPHVAGALALLLSARSGLSVVDQQALLTNGAVDLGPVGPDNTYGVGRLNVLNAYYGVFPNALARIFMPLVQH